MSVPPGPGARVSVGARRTAAPTHVHLDHDTGADPSQDLRALFCDVLGDVLRECRDLHGGKTAVLTQACVVDPPFFGNGDIGRLAVCAMVNELAARGAEPLAVTVSAIVEAGLSLRRLSQVAASVREAAQQAGVVVPAVDVRVVRAGEADQIYLDTTGFGLYRDAPLRARDARTGDAVVLTGALGGYGAHILSLRETLGYEILVAADCTPLAGLLAHARRAVPAGAVRAARPILRGGLAHALHTYARETGLGLHIEESTLVIPNEVQVALDALTLDPWHAPSAASLCLLVAADHHEKVLTALRGHPDGTQATTIGEMTTADTEPVRLRRGDGVTEPLQLQTAPAARLA